MVPGGGEFLRQFRLPGGGGTLTRLGINGQGMALAGLALAMAVAAALRLPELGTWSLWVDEIATAVFVSLTWQDLTGPLAWLETTPPTYYLLIKAWTTVAGGSDAALRLPSVFAGLASIAVLWRLCREAFGHRAAFWAAMILAVTGWHIFHSRDARVYALLTLVVLLALLAGRAFAAQAGSVGQRWIFPAARLAVLAAFAVWLHFTGVIAASMAFIYPTALIVMRGGFNLRVMSRLTAAASLSFILMLPPLALAWHVAGADGADGVLWMRDYGTRFAVLSIMRVVLLSPWTIDPWSLLGPACAALAALICAILIWIAMRTGPRIPDRAAMAVTLFGGIGLFLAFNCMHPLVIPRTLQVLLPLTAALMGAGLAKIRPGVVRVLIFATFIISQAPSLSDAFTAPPDGSDWRGLSAQLAQEDEPARPVIAFDVFDALALIRYRAPSAPVAALLMLPPSDTAMQRFVAGRLLDAPAVWPTDVIAALCDASVPVTGFFVVERTSPILGQVHSSLQASASASGAQPGIAIGDRRLHLRPWSAPACPPQPPATP
ncbi:glycosyltransferase family 39 protein [Roseomonas sp. CAU 1739]|uniref:glycosyltransferase family 39 protein n=1 Tax=Roseomonas sp. CAU 1739 TaxID=3140364 RepID=UPI00325B3893